MDNPPESTIIVIRDTIEFLKKFLPMSVKPDKAKVVRHRTQFSRTYYFDHDNTYSTVALRVVHFTNFKDFLEWKDETARPMLIILCFDLTKGVNKVQQLINEIDVTRIDHLTRVDVKSENAFYEKAGFDRVMEIIQHIHWPSKLKKFSEMMLIPKQDGGTLRVGQLISESVCDLDRHTELPFEFTQQRMQEAVTLFGEPPKALEIVPPCLSMVSPEIGPALQEAYEACRRMLKSGESQSTDSELYDDEDGVDLEALILDQYSSEEDGEKTSDGKNPKDTEWVLQIQNFIPRLGLI